MNFKISIFVAFIVCTLMVLATSPPATEQGQGNNQATRGNENPICVFRCFSNKDRRQKCFDDCMKGLTSTGVAQG